MDAQTILQHLVRRDRLDAQTAERLFDLILDGQLDPAQVAGALAMLQTRSPAAEEIAGAARAMRRHAVAVRQPDGRTVIDTCGTGGAPKMFNVSTTAALIAASIRPPGSRPGLAVAKHGNRSRTGRGSAEVLQTLGVNVDAGPDIQARCLAEAGMCFCFAIHHHPAMRHAIGPRRSLGFPTIFNLLGPLTNPAGARRQVVGVYREDLLYPMAAALRTLGAERAIVVHGIAADGRPIDELTTLGQSTLLHVEPSGLRTERISPASLGLSTAAFDDLAVESLDEAASLVREIVEARPVPARETALLSAAAAAVVGGLADTLAEGLDLARRAVDDGHAARTLDVLIAISNEGT